MASEKQKCAVSWHYRLSSSYSRNCNTTADRIDACDNLNLSYRIPSRSSGIDFLLYAHNLLSQKAIVNISHARRYTGRYEDRV